MAGALKDSLDVFFSFSSLPTVLLLTEVGVSECICVGVSEYICV